MCMFILFSEEKVMKTRKAQEKKEINPICLIYPSEAKSILLKKYNITREEKDIDINLRFILGKCNPVILVPGIFSTRLKIEVDCGKIFEKEKENYKNIKFFCGSSQICLNNNKYKDTLFLSLIGPFGIFGSNDVYDIKEYIKQNNGTFIFNNYKSACLGFLMNFFNKKMNVLKQKIIKKFVIILII